MMSRGVFEFFEVVAEELVNTSPQYITSRSLSAQGQSSILDDLQKHFAVNTHADAITSAVAELEKHFKGKDAALPFDYDPMTARFIARDNDFLMFIKSMKGIRSIGKQSRVFECSVATRLKNRATGAIHRVGHPRDTKKRKVDFNAHLRTLGFKKAVLLGQEKDGGLDIIWQLPLGSVPHRPFISMQCKNGKFEWGVADASSGSGIRSLSQHSGLQAIVHIPCIFFNDYFWPERLGLKQLQFVPLGLTDLASMLDLVTVDLI